MVNDLLREANPHEDHTSESLMTDEVTHHMEEHRQGIRMKNRHTVEAYPAVQIQDRDERYLNNPEDNLLQVLDRCGS